MLILNSIGKNNLPNCQIFLLFAVTLFLFLSSEHSVAQSSRGLTAFTEPYVSIDLSASEIGRIAKINVRRGSRVKQGDLLCELDISTLLARRKIAEQRSRSTAKRDALEVDYQRLLRRYESLQAISREGGGSPEELANAEAEAQVAKFNMKSAEEELERAKLEVAEIDALIEQRRIRATIDGIVIDVHHEAGEFVSASDPKVVTLVDLSRLKASFFLPTKAAASLKEGSTTALRFVGQANETQCTVEYIGPLTLADSGRVRVDVVLDNQGSKFRSGLQCVLPGIANPATKAAEVEKPAR